MKKQGFLKNQVDQCTCLNMSGGNFTIPVLYVDDILLASNSLDMLHESKRLLSISERPLMLLALKYIETE
jgi:hypothetical protein